MLYAKILDKLARSSVETPANVPLLCVHTFSRNDANWVQLSAKFNAAGLNVRLIELAKGVPVNAQFYLSNLDLIYLKTAEDLVGYVPRKCCRPVSAINAAATAAAAQNGESVGSGDLMMMMMMPNNMTYYGTGSDKLSDVGQFKF